MGTHFLDNFSKQAANYSIYRPQYPQSLFDFIFSQCNDYQIVWDCATGNGQAVKTLAAKFDHVYASDASEAQIAKTNSIQNVDFFVGNAYNSDLKDESVDLITVATAVHWFDIDLFYKEAQRILKPGGIIAYWTYSWHEVSPQIDDFQLFRDK
jgi:ubiquinone/menaquinone biosynthesis C-methylase UbiE